MCTLEGMHSFKRQENDKNNYFFTFKECLFSNEGKFLKQNKKQKWPKQTKSISNRKPLSISDKIGNNHNIKCIQFVWYRTLIYSKC